MPDVATEPVVQPALVERTLTKLGFSCWPALDVAGLITLFDAYSGSVPFDNLRKRIWISGDQREPLPGTDPNDFFENWVRHGTGATCWPSNGALFALLRAVGFDSRRIAGTILIEGLPGPNHGSVIVRLNGADYLVDGNLGAFGVLRLKPGGSSRTGTGINEVRAVPYGRTWDVLWYAGHNRVDPFTFRLQPEYDPVDHQFFVERYDHTLGASPFNESLYLVRRFRDEIVTIGRNNKLVVKKDGTLTRSEITEDQRRTALVEELGISEEVASMVPPDVAGATSLF